MARCDPPALLVINAGSSSVKFALFEMDESAQPIVCGELDGIGDQPFLSLVDTRHPASQKQAVTLPDGTPPQEAALGVVLDALDSVCGDYTIVGVGHRVVHGGLAYAAPVVITDAVLESLTRLCSLAPLHQPHNLAAIRAMAARRPDVPQVACFDTAFHRTCPDRALRFALPRRFDDLGIRRYGFHGLSYEYIAQQLPRIAGHMPERVIVAHLGAGASLCALHHGKSAATTMGFTALDGLMMGTRCGNIDPGVLLHFLTQLNMTAADIEHVLYRESGLLGVSGISADMRTLLHSSAPAAHEAIELFCYRIQREIGSLTAALGGLDGLVFTAGMGEHAHAIRETVCNTLGWLGLSIDPEANAQHALCVSQPQSRVGVWVIPTDEQHMIKQHTQRLLSA